MLGYLYDLGLGTRRSRLSAMHWYLRSYRAGDASSASNIATMYRDSGQHKLEFDWYLRAAEMGDGDAKLEVAIRYLSGKGVRRNLGRAIQYLVATRKTKYTSESAKDVAWQLLLGCKTKRRASNYRIERTRER